MTNKLIYLLCVPICISMFSCRSKKEMEVFGFAYKGEVIVVKNEEDTILSFKVDSRAGSNSICSFTRKIRLNSQGEEFHLRVIVDSNSNKVLDTNISFSKQYKKPFISLLHPLDKKEYNRNLFVGDKADSNFHHF